MPVWRQIVAVRGRKSAVLRAGERGGVSEVVRFLREDCGLGVAVEQLTDDEGVRLHLARAS